MLIGLGEIPPCCIQVSIAQFPLAGGRRLRLPIDEEGDRRGCQLQRVAVPDDDVRLPARTQRRRLNSVRTGAVGRPAFCERNPTDRARVADAPLRRDTPRARSHSSDWQYGWITPQGAWRS